MFFRNSKSEIDNENDMLEGATELNQVNLKPDGSINRENHIQRVPDAVLRKHILENCEDKTLGIFMRVSKKYYQLASSELSKRYMERNLGSNLKTMLLEACDAYLHHNYRGDEKDKYSSSYQFELINNITKLRWLLLFLSPDKHVVSLMILTRTMLKWRLGSYDDAFDFNRYLISRFEAHQFPTSNNKIDEKIICKDFKHKLLSITYKNAQQKITEENGNGNFSIDDMIRCTKVKIAELEILIKRCFDDDNQKCYSHVLPMILKNFNIKKMLTPDSDLSRQISIYYEQTTPTQHVSYYYM